MPHITGLDHAIVAVNDLAAGEAAVGRLGFRPTPRGVHSPHMGTANSTIVFHGNTYFEVLGVVADTEHNQAIRDGLAAGHHLFGVALKTESADEAAAAFAKEGIGAGPANAFARPVEMPGGEREAAFRTANIAPSATPGAYTFVCQHLTPDVVWRTDYLDQPNAVVGVKEVVGVADDLDAVARAWEAIAPGQATIAGDTAKIDFGNATVGFLTPAAFHNRFGTQCAAPTAMGALVFASSDLDATRRALAEAGIEGSLIAGPEAAAGITMAFVAA
ncbi:MAG: VOC family protein [Devosia sp.]